MKFYVFRLESDNTVPFIILQADTRILLGGSDGSIHQFKNNGKQISTVATGSDIIYSLAVSNIFKIKDFYIIVSGISEWNALLWRK